MLSIVFVNYKSSADLSRCLASIERHDPGFPNYEIVVVDNRSSDMGLPKLLPDYPSVRLIEAERNGGFSFGNNIGIRSTTGDFILFLNPDTYVEDDSIGKMHDRMLRDPSVAMLGPKLLFPDGRNQSFFEPKSHFDLWKLFCYEFSLHRLFPGSRLFDSLFRIGMDYEVETPVESVPGSALMFRRELIEIIGEMDERYFMYFEEMDFCLRATRNGGKLLYFPAGRIYHVGGLTRPEKWPLNARAYAESFKYFFSKHFPSWQTNPAIALLLFGALIRWAGLSLAGRERAEYYRLIVKHLVHRDLAA